MKIFMLLFFVLVFSSCDSTSSKSPDQGFEKILSTLQQENNVPGLGAGFLKDDELEVSVSGTLISGKTNPLDENSPFHLGSCSKSMTATLAAILIEEGQLEWNSPVKDLLPEFANHYGFETLTFEMLLSHRSGIATDGPETFLNDWMFKALRNPLLSTTQARALYSETLLGIAPISLPGEKFRYANGNYMIAAFILEKLTGKAWEQLMQEKLFTPLAMTSCGQGPTWGHYRNLTQIIAVFRDNPLPLAPAAGIHCGLKDWSKYLGMHLKGARGEASLLTVESFQKLHTLAANDGQNYTYGGWIKVKRDWSPEYVLTHNGTNTWNYAQVWLSPFHNAALMSTANIGGADGVKATDGMISELIKTRL